MWFLIDGDRSFSLPHRYAADVSTSKFLGFRFPLSCSFFSLEVKAQFISDLDLTICFNLCGGENSATFEYEKGLNIDNVEQLQAMEKNLVGMAREMEKLHAEVVNAEMRGHGDFSCLYRWFH